MPRPRPRLRERRPEFKPFSETDGRITHHATGCDFFDEGYGATADDFDRERMREDWETRREEIVEMARAAYPHIKVLWSELEFDRAST